MSAWFSPAFRQPPPLDRPRLQAQLTAVEGRLAQGDHRLARVWACLVQQQARGRNTRASEMTLQSMEYLMAQWQRQRQALLDTLWQDAG